MSQHLYEAFPVLFFNAVYSLDTFFSSFVVKYNICKESSLNISVQFNK